MTQRNPNNDRYREENRGGKTRKSAASAKPAAVRAATVHTPAPKTKKQKKQEARERERKQEQKYAVATPNSKVIEDLPEYKKLRKLWWVCLGCSIACIAASFFVTTNEALSFLYVPLIIAGYILIILAFYIDFGRIRKLRKQFEQTVIRGKSKEARASQKAARAEARAQQKEAEKNAEAEAGKEEQKATSPFARIGGKLFGSKESSAEAGSDGEEPPAKEG